MYLCAYSYWPLLGKCEIVPVLCRTSETKRKLLYIQYIIFSPDWNLIMDLSIKINVVNLQVTSSFRNSKYCMFKANSYYCSVYCFIDNFNIYWLVKNIWHAWNIYMQCHILLTCSSGKREKWPTFDKNPSYQPDIWKKKPKAAKHII